MEISLLVPKQSKVVHITLTGNTINNVWKLRDNNLPLPAKQVLQGRPCENKLKGALIINLR